MLCVLKSVSRNRSKGATVHRMDVMKRSNELCQDAREQVDSRIQAGFLKRGVRAVFEVLEYLLFK